ncbi:PSD1 and planctomycete cytochrome C domain-containing protein [Prosthecobacter sp.]|uniref:PSD1 and planctomycete cytochrome C domain-containing protein n=1 Tax=Prosthecobacter sp. TaxID=1965333 RepID=UPI002AC8CF91|nr:PSD1 and planctomycete cytochrome C domain-containing protein [Prosthecobacter sp.]
MTPDQRAFFESKIRPVLVKSCYECHAQGAKKIGGKLLLDAPSEMIVGGESGPSLIPGKPDESLIIQAVRYDGLEMPPKKRLPEQVVNDFITWVKMGAPDPRVDAPKSAKKTLTTDKAALWSYQPVTHPKPPMVKAKDWARDAIDSFVLAKIEVKGLSPTKDATPEMLIRRVYFDLIGLPPSAGEVLSFVSRHLSFQQVVDELLESPHFGERWGRHWLDVARYAESNGNDGLSRNPSFPHAWRYRDYVIRAFNEDMPYDRFITEQIAGDLLSADSEAQRDRQLIATGFLAIGAKPAKAMNDNFEMDVVADQIGVIGHGIMGLSVGCARCHDHKTDPIPTRDYYALAGIFKSTETLWGAAAHQGLTAPQTPLHELKTAEKVTVRPEAEAIISKHEPRRPPAKPAFKYAADAPLAMGVREAKTAVDCKLNIDGEAKKLGAAVPRGFLTACGAMDPSIQLDPKQSGRLQLAQWLTSRQHPQTARVMVNRVWQHLFGEGLVRTPADFGITGESPTHPELLDHLATRFMSEGWSIKRLIRSIVLSHTYQLSSQCDDKLREADSDNLLLARHNRRRLDAEAVRDAMLAATGDLNPQPGHGSLIQHQNVLINELPPLHQPSTHRSVYLLMLRNSMPPELTPFNLPDAVTVTGNRDSSTLATQSLYLLNNAFLVEQSKRFAKRLMKASSDSMTRIQTAYSHAFARKPTGSEIQRAHNFICEAELMLASTENDENGRLASSWAAFCQALLASNELRYVD